jgi:DKNYY family
MQISKIDTADTKTFKILARHYKYAMDKNFFYDEPGIIEGFVPSKTILKLDNKGRVFKMTCSNKTYKFAIVK